VTLNDLIAKRDALETARFEGVTSVTYDGRHIQYRSDAEMATAIADLNRRIAACNGQRPVSMITFSSRKGL